MVKMKRSMRDHLVPGKHNSMILVSPTEPKSLLLRLKDATSERIATSSTPEKFGCDFYFKGYGGMKVAVQRKRFPDDFTASMQGRLQREVPLMLAADIPVLIVEGEADYTFDGWLLANSRWSRKGLLNLQISIWRAEICVQHTDNHEGTVQRIVEMAEYFRKEEHLALLTIPKNIGSTPWGIRTKRHKQIAMMQSIEGIGYTLAAAFVDSFDGIPLRWDCTFERMLEVSGIGPNIAKNIWETVEDMASEEDE